MAKRLESVPEKPRRLFIRCQACGARVELRRVAIDQDCWSCHEMATPEGLRKHGRLLRGELGREAFKLIRMVLAKQLTAEEAIRIYEKARTSSRDVAGSGSAPAHDS